MNIYISKSDLPNANFTDHPRLYAGKGWLPLVLEAMPDIGTALICAIREDSGLLRIELASTYTSMRKEAIQLAEEKSAKTCEICGEPGHLRHELKNGKPAGWHRTRCDQHIDTRTSGITNVMGMSITNAIGRDPALSDISKAMTACQLIEILSKYPSDLPVLVEGYETGFDQIHSIVPAKAIPNPENQEHDGEFEKDGEGSDCLIILGKSEYRRSPNDPEKPKE
jgi:hypothetical protein